METVTSKPATKKIVSWVVLYTFFLLANQLYLHSSNSDSYTILPSELKENKFQATIGLSLTMIPREIVEEEIAQIPMLDCNLQYGLTNSLSLHLEFSTIYVTNSVSFGASWSKSWNGLSLSVGNMVEYWFGVAEMPGFDVSSNGLVYRPSISVGFDLKKYKLIAKAEAMINLLQNSTVGGHTFSNGNSVMSGLVFSLYLQQTLWKNNDIYLGAQLNYADPANHAWLAFPELDDWVVIPKISIGYVL